METSLRFSRRTFVAWVGGASAGFYLFGRLPGTSEPVALAQIPGGTLDPTKVPKFVTPMLIPPVMPRAGTIKQPGGKSVDYYEISMRQFKQQILPAGLPATTVWGYGAKAAQSNRGLLIHNAPSLTIEARWNRPVRVKWINELVDDERQLPAAPASGRPDAALGEPARRHRRVATAGRRSTRRPAPTRARCRSSPTCTAPSAWATRATATRKRGTCRPRTTSRRATPRKGRGTTSSPARPPPATASPGVPGSPSSSTRTTTGRRRSGTTTTRSG